MQNEIQPQSQAIMRCSKYPERPAAGICAYSGKPYSSEELVEVEGKMYGKDNLTAVMTDLKHQANKQQPMVFMNAGGAAASSSAAVSTGVALSAQSKGLTALVCFFLGMLGVHRFMTGHVMSGLLILGMTSFGWLLFFVPNIIAGLWVTIDFFMILFGSFRDKQGLPLA